MPTCLAWPLLAALLVEATCSDLSAQATRVFLGGYLFGPTNWVFLENWQNLIGPANGDNVIISQGAFAVLNAGATTLNQVELGSTANPSARLELARPSAMTIQSNFFVNAGR